MLSKNFLVPALLLLFIMSCKHKVAEPIDPASTVIGKDSICYAEDVQPLLSSSCANPGCHDAITKEEGVDLSSYASVKKTISGAELLEVIVAKGEERMPPSPRPSLTSSQISLLRTWVAQGMKDGVNCMGPCDTTKVTFSAVVFPILQTSCVNCHSSTAPLLTNYAQIKVQMDNGKLPCSINWDGSCSAMPKGGPQLSLCKRRQIMKWLLDGSPNN